MDTGSISYQASPGSSVAAPDSAAKSKRSRFAGRLRRAFQVAGIALIVGGASLLFMMALSWVRSQSAVAVVQAQVQDIRVGKVEEAYRLFSAGYQHGVSLPMFRRWLRHEDRLLRAQKVDFWGRSVWGETAVLWGNFQDDLGHSYPVRYLLIRENGSWRIDSFHVSIGSSEPDESNVRIIQI